MTMLLLLEPHARLSIANATVAVCCILSIVDHTLEPFRAALSNPFIPR
jgi:hypothetical protein